MRAIQTIGKFKDLFIKGEWNLSKTVYVTQPFLPPLKEFESYLEKIWETGVMTHNGPFMSQLENEISLYENVNDTVCLANGTCAMQLAIKALDLKGEIITTPFTFIATANIISWENCTPKFVDIDSKTWNLDPSKIEAAITKDTVGILPVHVFSAPCDVESIKRIADKHQLKVIYDAAHAMCVKVNGNSIMTYGDIACTSFHATKLFNTCEGGACFSPDPDILARLRRLRFFGFNEQKEVVDHGMNAKMTEISAALGLVNLKYLDQVRKNRKINYHIYKSLLEDCHFIKFQMINPEEYNFSYMPVLFDNEKLLLRCVKRLCSENIFTRRYFYPALNQIEILKSKCLPVAENISKRILCLPQYDTLIEEDIIKICNIVKMS